MSDQKPAPPQTTWLERDQAYLVSPVLRHEGTATTGQNEPLRIRLRLEDGSLLAIPFPQAAIDNLATFLCGLATPQA